MKNGKPPQYSKYKINYSPNSLKKCNLEKHNTTTKEQSNKYKDITLDSKDNKPLEDEGLLGISIELYNKMKELNDVINDRKGIDHSYLDITKRNYGYATGHYNTKPITLPRNIQTERTNASQPENTLKIRNSFKGMSNCSTREGFFTDKSQPLSDFLIRNELWLLRKNEKIDRKRRESKINETINCTFSPRLIRNNSKRRGSTKSRSTKRKTTKEMNVTMLANMKFH